MMIDLTDDELKMLADWYEGNYWYSAERCSDEQGRASLKEEAPLIRKLSLDKFCELAKQSLDYVADEVA